MDVEQMYAAASEEYKNNYSTGEYCHEQSFLWGFQEGVEFSESNSGKELLYVAQKTTERTKKEFINKACQVFSEILIEVCPELLGYGSVAKTWEKDFRKKLEE